MKTRSWLPWYCEHMTKVVAEGLQSSQKPKEKKTEKKTTEPKK